MPNVIRVAIVEDVRDIRESLQALISGMPGYYCAGIFATAEAAIADMWAIAPDVVLMDINLPGMSGVEAVRRLKENFPNVSFLMCTVFEDNENIFRALEAGAGGYILKNNSPLKLLEAIKEVYEGGAPMSAAIAKKSNQFVPCCAEGGRSKTCPFIRAGNRGAAVAFARVIV